MLSLSQWVISLLHSVHDRPYTSGTLAKVYFQGWVRTLGTSGQPHDSFLEHWPGKYEQCVMSVFSGL